MFSSLTNIKKHYLVLLLPFFLINYSECMKNKKYSGTFFLTPDSKSGQTSSYRNHYIYNIMNNNELRNSKDMRIVLSILSKTG